MSSKTACKKRGECIEMEAKNKAGIENSDNKRKSEKSPEEKKSSKERKVSSAKEGSVGNTA